MADKLLTVGPRVVALGEWFRLNQRQWGEELGVDRSTIASYKNIPGKGPSRERLKEIAERYGVPIAWFYETEHSEPPVSQDIDEARKAAKAANASSDDTGRRESHLTDAQASTHIKADTSLLGPKTKIRAYIGGSARPFTMSSDHVEEVEAPLNVTENHIPVVVSDGTLKPEIPTGTVLVFEKTSRPEEGPLILVERIDQPGTYAVRRFDPDGEDGHGTFVDKRGILDTLSSSEWRVRGILAAMTARGWLMV